MFLYFYRNTIMEQTLEKVITLLVETFSKKTNLKKPTLFHSIRVGMYLYEHWYDEDICIAWFLHDVLEDTDLSENQIESNFGKKVLNIIQANTKNETLWKEEKKKDVIERCIAVWIEALIVKSADIIDNYNYWSKKNDQNEMERCFRLRDLMQEYIWNKYNDQVIMNLFTIGR